MANCLIASQSTHTSLDLLQQFVGIYYTTRYKMEQKFNPISSLFSQRYLGKTRD